MRNEKTYSHVEKTVIRCISALTGKVIDKSDIYSGKTKCPACISMARGLVFLFLHDHYGITYKSIARRAGMKENSVIHVVVKVRNLRFTDKLYQLAYEKTEKSL